MAEKLLIILDLLIAQHFCSVPGDTYKLLNNWDYLVFIFVNNSVIGENGSYRILSDMSLWLLNTCQ